MRKLSSVFSLLLAGALFVPLPALAQGGDAGAGEGVFRGRCAGCHTIDEGGRNRTGPNLFNAFGSPAGRQELGFRFSRAVSSSGVTWDETSLDRWLTSPRNFISGNRMSFGGLANPTDRADLIAFMRVMSTASAAEAAGPGEILAFRAVVTGTLVPGAGGHATVLLNTETSEISWLADYAGLSGDLTGVHFHGPAGPGDTAEVLINIGETSGIDGPLTGTAMLTETMVNSLREGQWYINLHTALNPPGEVRGQLVP